MRTEEKRIIIVKEGTTSSYFDAVEQVMPGKRTEDSFQSRMGGNRLDLFTFQLLAEFEITLLNLFLQDSYFIKRSPDERPDLFHMSLIKKGDFIRRYQNKQEYAQVGSSVGLFLHNGLFPLDTEFPPHTEMRTLNVKFSRAAITQFIPEADMLLSSLFPDDEPKWYHTHVSPELERLAKDIFFLQKADFGNKALVLGRGLELSTLLLSSLNQQLRKDDLHGLHIDDYNRVMAIKAFVLSKVDTKISIEEISRDFGISTSKLKRDFKTVFDSSVSKFHTQAKMDEGFRRLRTGKYSVTEVGYDLGYQNAGKFSVMFKKVKGINPSDVIPLQ